MSSASDDPATRLVRVASLLATFLNPVSHHRTEMNRLVNPRSARHLQGTELAERRPGIF